MTSSLPHPGCKGPGTVFAGQTRIHEYLLFPASPREAPLSASLSASQDRWLPRIDNRKRDCAVRLRGVSAGTPQFESIR
jgi:hypothetical protein